MALTDWLQGRALGGRRGAAVKDVAQLSSWRGLINWALRPAFDLVA